MFSDALGSGFFVAQRTLCTDRRYRVAAELSRLNSPLQGGNELAILWHDAFVGFASPLANHYGLQPPLVWLNIMGSGAVSVLMQKHASVLTLLRQGDRISLVTIFFLLGLGLFYLALLAGTERKARRFTWFIPWPRRARFMRSLRWRFPNGLHEAAEADEQPE